MKAFKGFNSKLQATMGKGTYQFEAGKKYIEKECKCASNGFHCAEDPLCALGYYGGPEDRYFIVKAEGDINQDGYESRISCTEMTLVKEISKIEMGAYACKYISTYPERTIKSGYLRTDKGKSAKKDDFIIVRGKSPVAAGVKGSYFFLLQEQKKGREIKGIYPVYVDGVEILPGRYYGLRGGEVCEKKN